VINRPTFTAFSRPIFLVAPELQWFFSPPPPDCTPPIHSDGDLVLGPTFLFLSLEILLFPLFFWASKNSLPVWLSAAPVSLLDPLLYLSGLAVPSISFGLAGWPIMITLWFLAPPVWPLILPNGIYHCWFILNPPVLVGYSAIPPLPAWIIPFSSGLSPHRIPGFSFFPRSHFHLPLLPSGSASFQVLPRLYRFGNPGPQDPYRLFWDRCVIKTVMGIFCL